MRRVRLRGKGATASGYSLEIDGRDVSRFVKNVWLQVNVDQPNVISVEFYADQIDVEADAELMGVDLSKGTKERTSLADRFRKWLR